METWCRQKSISHQGSVDSESFFKESKYELSTRGQKVAGGHH